MKEHPIIHTDRLILRPFTLADAPGVQRLAGDRDIAWATPSIPHPYEDGMAEQWISTHQERYERGELVNFAITLRSDKSLIGSIGLSIHQRYERGELGYWVGKPYWNNGYCTEAAKAVVQYAFAELGLNRIHASHLKRNPASGRVMQKIGMVYEGCQRQGVLQWGVFEDLELYGMLKSDYESQMEART